MPSENIHVVTSAGDRAGLKVLHIKGPLTIHTIFGFQNAVRADESPSLIVDFSGVPYIDSAGLGALVGAFIGAERAQRKLVFAAMNERVTALLEMTHVSQVFKRYASVQEAEAAIS
jgi:anti-sigma B factor antagonist